MKTNPLPGLAAILLILAAAPLRADIDNGMYIGFGLMDSEVDVSQIGDKETAANFNLGYRYNRFMATEFGIYYLGNFSDSAVVGPVAGKAEFDGWVTGVALVPRLPIWIFDLYARAGLGYYDVSSEVVTSVGGKKDDDTGFNFYGSVGGSVNIGRNWSLYLEYNRFYTSDLVESVGFGGRYHF
jgi:OOP family OmpA-OmpF porin